MLTAESLAPVVKELSRNGLVCYWSDGWSLWFLGPLFFTFGEFLAQLFKEVNVVHVGVAGGPLSPQNRRGPLDVHKVRTPVAGGPLSPPEVLFVTGDKARYSLSGLSVKHIVLQLRT